MIEIKPCYLFYGEEKYLIERDIHKFIEYFNSAGVDEFNQSFFDGEKDDIEMIVETALTMPLFSNCRLIVVKNSPWFKEDKSDILKTYLKNPLDDVCIIFVADAIDKRREEVKLIAECGKVREYKSVADMDMPKFVRSYIGRYGKTIDANALNHFIMLTSRNLFIITSELDKLISYLGDESIITLDMVQKMIAHTNETSSFELINAISNRGPKMITMIVDELVPNYKIADELRLFGLIVSQIRLLVMVKEMSATMSYKEIASKLKIHEYRIKKAIEGANNYSMYELCDSLKLLMIADSKNKSGNGDFYNILLATLLEICSKR